MTPRVGLTRHLTDFGELLPQRCLISADPQWPFGIVLQVTRLLDEPTQLLERWPGEGEESAVVQQHVCGAARDRGEDTRERNVGPVDGDDDSEVEPIVVVGQCFGRHGHADAVAHVLEVGNVTDRRHVHVVVAIELRQDVDDEERGLGVCDGERREQTRARIVPAEQIEHGP